MHRSLIVLERLCDGLMVLTIALAGLLVLAFAASAADPKLVCAISLDKAISDAEELHGYLVDLIAVPAADFDQLLVTVANGGIWIAPVKDGCIVRAPFPLAPVREETPA